MPGTGDDGSAALGAKTWKAYLSTSAARPTGGNARDRIGAGPWLNQKGVMIANSLDNLHSNNHGLTAATAIDEKGAAVPNKRHDILTGSTAAGMLKDNPLQQLDVQAT